MHKKDLVAKVAREGGLSQNEAANVVDAIFEALTKSLAAGKEVRITGFGTFRVSERAATQGRNPRTGMPMTIPASRLPKFRPSKALKVALAGDPTTPA